MTTTQANIAQSRLTWDQNKTISGLGRLSTGKSADEAPVFEAGELCMESLRDLLRYLRSDHPQKRPL